MFNAAQSALQRYINAGGIEDDDLRQIRQNERKLKVMENNPAMAVAAGAVGYDPSFYDSVTPRGQQADQAHRQVLDFVMKTMTGAGMPDNEAIRRTRVYRPEPGESAASRRQKDQALMDTVRMIGMAGTPQSQADAERLLVAPGQRPGVSTGAPSAPSGRTRLVGRDRASGLPVYEDANGNRFVME
jgi:hypothetical protein